MKYWVIILSILFILSAEKTVHAKAKKSVSKKTSVSKKLASKSKAKSKTAKSNKKSSKKSDSKYAKSYPTMTKAEKRRVPASLVSDGDGADKPIQVKGQNRNISMMLTLKSEKDKINFGDIRDNYNSEISTTSY